jgi:hypothetical protein
VVEDELVPNVLLTSTVESVLKDTRATQTILDQALHGNFRKVERDRLKQLERESRELTGR